MTATRKLFAAAALIAAGFGVATLIGKPAARTHAPQLAGALVQTQPSTSAMSAAPPAAPYIHRDVRLVPDFGSSDASQLAAAPLLVEVAPQALPVAGEDASGLTESIRPRDVESPAAWKLPPRARLRNEAPRPLAVDSPAPPASENPPSGLVPPAITADIESSTPAAPSLGALSSWDTAGTVSPHAGQPPAAIPTIVASYQEESATASDVGPISPPPWPAPEVASGPRTHIVVDGDSLARLAGRYLDDPHRAGEVFDANRGLLADPDLLPIGAELVIPSRASSPSAAPRSPQSFVPRAVAVHAPAGARLVPVRPIPSSAAIVPRAQLARPLPVE